MNIVDHIGEVQVRDIESPVPNSTPTHDDIKLITCYWILGKCATFGIALMTWAFLGRSSDQRGSFLESLVCYDQWHYLKIAQDGYSVTDATTTAFYPLLPILIRLFNTVLFGSAVDFPQGAIVSFFISFIASWFSMYYLFRLCRIYMISADHHLCMLLWAIGPTAVFLTVGYTEPLFFALSFAAVFYMIHRAWIPAGILVSLACITRPPGILVYTLLAAYALLLCPRSTNIKEWGQVLVGLVLPAITLSAYMAFQYVQFGDHLASLHVEQSLWHQFIIWPWQWPDYLGGLFVMSTDDPAYQAMIMFNFAYLSAGIIAVGLTVSSRNIPWLLKGFAILVVISIVCRSSEMSMPRMLMAAFPVYMALAEWGSQSSAIRYNTLVVSFVSLNAVGTVLFLLEKSFF